MPQGRDDAEAGGVAGKGPAVTGLGLLSVFAAVWAGDGLETPDDGDAASDAEDGNATVEARSAESFGHEASSQRFCRHGQPVRPTAHQAIASAATRCPRQANPGTRRRASREAKPSAARQRRPGQFGRRPVFKMNRCVGAMGGKSFCQKPSPKGCCATVRFGPGSDGPDHSRRVMFSQWVRRQTSKRSRESPTCRPVGSPRAWGTEAPGLPGLPGSWPALWLRRQARPPQCQALPRSVSPAAQSGAGGSC
jgi:hypothetical protein